MDEGLFLFLLFSGFVVYVPPIHMHRASLDVVFSLSAYP